MRLLVVALLVASCGTRAGVPLAAEGAGVMGSLALREADTHQVTTVTDRTPAQADFTADAPQGIPGDSAEAWAEEAPSPPARAATVARTWTKADVENVVRNAFTARGLDADFAVKVMLCESSGDPYAVNPVSGATGAFQFVKSTYLANARLLFGHDVEDERTDPVRSSLVAAFKVQRDGWSAWSQCVK